MGFIGWPAIPDQRVTSIRRGIQAIVHRGPDEVGYYHDSRFTLGTARLYIVDPAMGKQPMATADGRFVLGFNGEIFNYLELRAELTAAGLTFTTRSDTEVLLKSLAHWGIDEALTRINGQFGFAFYDRGRGDLVLGRDPWGERPMYYAIRDGACFFASEIKGLFAFPQVPRVLDGDRVLAAARFWTPIPDETCFAQVQCLPPGHYLSVRNTTVGIRRYYEGLEAGLGKPVADLTFEEGLVGLRQALRDSVRLRLRGDYQVGAFVSGGVDSAIIAATASEVLGEQLRTFSLRIDGPGMDETSHQEKVVAALGLDHSSVVLRDTDIRERFPRVIAHCEVPLHRTAPVACDVLAEHVRASGVRIVLLGEGADELFLGYDIIKEARILEECLRDGSFDGAGPRLDAVLNDLRHTSSLSGTDVLHFYRDRLGSEALSLGPHLRRFEAEPLHELIRSEQGTSGADERMRTWIRYQAPDFLRWTMVERAQWLDIQTMFMGYELTCHGDRPGISRGVETRFPYLDRAVVEFASGLPVDWKLSRLGREKHILREAYRDALPREVIDRPKFGMRTPGAAALMPGGPDDWVEAALAPESLRASSVLRESAVRGLVRGIQRYRGTTVPYPSSHAYLHVLSILLLEQMFVREFRIADADIDRTLVQCLDGDVMPTPSTRSMPP